MYKSLLLSAGGGILSDTQKADAAPNTVSILIGLGGTGISCLRTVKTQVYDRIKPDNLGAITPYKTIRFIGVDTDDSEQEKKPKNGEDHEVNVDVNLKLDKSEYFSIANPDVKAAFKAKRVLEQRSDTKWLRYDKISAPDFGRAGAGGIRQVGRYMMMLRANDFRNTVIREIEQARQGTDAQVYIHLFSGISGGTGAGAFLDICYLLRSITQFGTITILGYFFLPDVNLSVIDPGDNATLYVPKNGYASLQELDYCMRLQFNGGAFEQSYNGLPQPVRWDGQPVDMCHLIGGTDSDGKKMPNAYDYAMNVTAEYVMDFLAASIGDDGTAGIESQQANVSAKVRDKDGSKEYGVNLNYLSIGASCAKLPLREINTYLAAVLFREFAEMSKNKPTEQEVMNFLYSTLVEHARTLDETYDMLYDEIREGADESYEDAPITAAEAKKYGINDTLLFYRTQTTNKTGAMEVNRSSMLSNKNEKSLINRILRGLQPILTDIQRGPVYVSRMFEAAIGYNLLNLMDGLIKINNDRRDEESEQHDLRKDDYDAALEVFDRKNGPLNERRFNEYKWYTVAREQHNAKLAAFDALGNTLEALKQQLLDWSVYFSTLAGVMTELKQTFEADLNTLGSENYLKKMRESFAEPLIEFDEAFKKRLDREIYGDAIKPGMDIGSMFKRFMEFILRNDGEWMEGNEIRIYRLVTKYFMEDAFKDFATYNITEYLQDKYGVYGNADELAKRVCEDWMTRLRSKAKPLFRLDEGTWRDNPSRLGYISVPAISHEINAAAVQSNAMLHENYQVRQSALEDRIYVMVADCAFPLSSYIYRQDYENLYAKELHMYGRHYYENKGVPDDVPFKDWRELPSLLPQSAIELSDVEDGIRKITKEGREVYRKAVAYGLLDDRNILEPEPESLDELRAALAECRGCMNLKENSEVRAARNAIDRLAKAKNIRMRRTGLCLQEDGSRDVDPFSHESFRDRITQDYLVSSPALGAVINKSVQVIDELVTEADRVIQEAEAAIRELERVLAEKSNFCNALFTGVLSYRDGLTITYSWRRGGRPMLEDLCKYGKDYPFSNVPIYQAYRSYAALDPVVKDAISADTEAKMNSNRDELVSPAKMLRDEFDQMETAWNENAYYYQEAEEIRDFLGFVKERLDIHCRNLRI